MTEQRNEAAERLRGMLPRIDGGLSDRLLTDALATERRLTVPSVDHLAQIIRTVDGSHSLGAGRLAEAIVAALLDELGEQRP